jgi:hypothetical protein
MYAGVFLLGHHLDDFYVGFVIDGALSGCNRGCSCSTYRRRALGRGRLSFKVRRLAELVHIKHLNFTLIRIFR